MNFLDRFSKNPEMPNLMKIRPVGAEFQADGWTYMMKLIVAFRNFAKAPNTGQLMRYREIIAIWSHIHTKHINTLCGQNVELYIKIQPVPRSKHTPSRL